jgi:hypothetical protein
MVTRRERIQAATAARTAEKARTTAQVHAEARLAATEASRRVLQQIQPMSLVCLRL